MVSEESLISCFSNLGCDISDKSVIAKCLQICRTYSIEEEAFVELWVAYSVPLSLNINPTLEDLNKLEEKELMKSRESLRENGSNETSSMIAVVQSNEDFTDSNVLDVYSSAETPTTTTRQIKRPRSPVAEIGNENKVRAVDHHIFVPSTYTANTDVPGRAPSTTTRGKVLLSFGPGTENRKKENEEAAAAGATAAASVVVRCDKPHVPKDAVYMFEMLPTQCAVLSSRCKSFGERLCRIWSGTCPAQASAHYVRNVASVSQAAFRTWGRIAILLDKSSGKKVVMLEGCKRSRYGRSSPFVRLDLNEVKHYAVFPGQIVAVEGINTAGKSFTVKELFAKGYAALSDVPGLSKHVTVHVAVGPFTPADNLNYQPLWDLMERVAEEEPDILILVGPFVDCGHPELKKCTLKDTFQDFFDDILAKIMQHLSGKSTRVVLVSSNRDVHHDAVFPTPEFHLNAKRFGSNVSNLHAMPDPCIINVDGLRIGVTSVDVLRHLGQQEISNTPGMDRLGRLADLVLSQATFYPLHPPPAGLNLDTTLWKKYACFDRQPHIMVLPSDVKYYCKTSNDCLLVNPERLQKYIYAKLCVRPVRDGKWNPNSVSCVIAKV